jgi:regulator of PEP synthase PpsR (kinase-PPPase family)
MYLGYLGYRTANIPLVAGIPPPRELFAVDRWKIVGLTIDPVRLQAIRKKRVMALGSTSGSDGYTELVRIYEELDEVTEIQRRLGCPIIDTTELALEEAAGRVLELIERRRMAALGE